MVGSGAGVSRLVPLGSMWKKRYSAKISCGQQARRLYREYAAAQPIFNYHCHLPPAEIAEDKRWPDIASHWLGGDHYKWRAMRSAGIAERFCTGDATPWEKSSVKPRRFKRQKNRRGHLASRCFSIKA